MNKLQEDKLATIVIDLGVRKDQINESFLSQFGTAIELILKRMFGLNDLDFKLRGPRNSVDKFIRTLEKERDYARTLRRLGLDNPSSLGSKWQLDKAVKEFEKTTGIKWPLK